MWDWFGAWHASFSAMLNRLSNLSGIPQRQLEREIREVHKLRGTTEYSLLLNELPSLRAKDLHAEPLSIYDEAIHVLNSERIKNTHLYPGVRNTLQELKRRNIPVVAYTESVAYWSEWRIRHTGLDGLIQVMYSSPDHDFPDGINAEDLRTRPKNTYGLRRTTHQHAPLGTLKPDTQILRLILSDFAIDPRHAVYVGDSLMKDVAMAQRAGVHDVHAKYGVSQHRKGYDLLRRVSHWTQSDIAREKALEIHPAVTPSHVFTGGFHELLHTFDFRKA